MSATVPLKARASASARTTGQPAVDDGSEFLVQLGERVRDARARRSMTRKDLARESQVSERYLAQLEAGHGNISVLLLRQIAAALSLPLDELLHEDADHSAELTLIEQFLQRLPAQKLAQVRAQLVREFGNTEDRSARSHRAGRLARRRQVDARRAAREASSALPFLELDREIEREAGTSLSEIFLLYGQAGYRRYERRCLEKLLEQRERCVIATGGSIVSEPATYDLLLSTLLHGLAQGAARRAHGARAWHRATRARWQATTRRWTTCSAFSSAAPRCTGRPMRWWTQRNAPSQQSLKDLKKRCTRLERGDTNMSAVCTTRIAASIARRYLYDHAPGSLCALAADLRRPGRHAVDGRRTRKGHRSPATSSSSTPTTSASTSSCYDALQRIRFEHPEVKCVVITSAKERMFCSGANIYMLGLSTHAWKVNFCKFTNETRNGMEDSSRHDGPQVPRRGERHRGRRRLRARARLRRDPHGRRSLVHREPARGAAARRAARHRRADARDRQAQECAATSPTCSAAPPRACAPIAPSSGSWSTSIAKPQQFARR